MRFFILFALGAALVAGGCKKKNSAAPVVKKEEPAPPPVDERNSAFVPGGGAIQNSRQAVKRVDHQNDIRNLGVLIFDFELTNGKLPTASEIKAAMTVGDWASVRKKVDEGVIILTGTTKKDGLWAYEVDADKVGGIVLTGPTPNTRRANADEVKQLLANN
jgi:hypothetical protein